MLRLFVDLPPGWDVFDASMSGRNYGCLLTRMRPTCTSPSSLTWPASTTCSPTTTPVSTARYLKSGTSFKSSRRNENQQGLGRDKTWMDFSWQRRCNETHASTTEWKAKLVRKGFG